MEPFKNKYSKESITILAKEIKKVHTRFNSKRFIDGIIDDGLNDLEMKDRVRLISQHLHFNLPKNYEKALTILIHSLSDSHHHEEYEWDGKTGSGVSGFLAWPYGQFIEDYGINHFHISMRGIYELTKRFTGEFTIRPFLNHNYEEVFKYLKKWKNDPSVHVRRLVSEGTRPNLPWGLKVSRINSNLEHNINLIASLRQDKEEYVRRSVANHLNDISHHDKELFMRTITPWKNESSYTDKVIRHASRSLLKKGEPKTLKLMGYKPNVKLNLIKFNLTPKRIKEGEDLNLKISLESKSNKKEKIIIDFIIDFVKKDGSLSPKVFRFKDTLINPGEIIDIKKKFSFKAVTTRKHYSGKHYITIQVNGTLMDKKLFTLKV